MARRRAKEWDVRGIMVDPARLVERHEFYFDLLEQMAAWGLNTLWWHFDDDEGFMLALDGH
ncbi:MAG: family 20 glycosylhydrolase, partial [Planctomycetota bacterium]